jgi:hypothetical protein
MVAPSNLSIFEFHPLFGNRIDETVSGCFPSLELVSALPFGIVGEDLCSAVE